jgi:hypothetical protein
MSETNTVLTVDVPLADDPTPASNVLIVPTNDERDGHPLYRVTAPLSHLTSWLSQHVATDSDHLGQMLAHARRASLGHAFKAGWHSGTSESQALNVSDDDEVDNSENDD